LRYEGIVNGSVKWLRRWRWPSTSGGDGDRSTSTGQQEDGDAHNGQATRAQCAQKTQGDPFDGFSPSVVANDSERSLRAGNSIVNREPSA
jgi:hypothetical protein